MPRREKKKKKKGKSRAVKNDFANVEKFDDPAVQRAHLIALAKEIFKPKNEVKYSHYTHKTEIPIWEKTSHPNGDVSANYEAARRNVLLASNTFEPGSFKELKTENKEDDKLPLVTQPNRAGTDFSVSDVVWLRKFEISPRKKASEHSSTFDEVVKLATEQILEPINNCDLDIPELKLQIPCGSPKHGGSPRKLRLRRNTEARLDEYFQLYGTDDDSYDASKPVPNTTCAVLRTENLLWHWGEAAVAMPRVIKPPMAPGKHSIATPIRPPGHPADQPRQTSSSSSIRTSTETYMDKSAAAIAEAHRKNGTDTREASESIVNSVSEDHKRLFAEYVSLCRERGVIPCGRLLECLEAKSGLIHTKTGELAALRLGFQSLCCTSVVSLVDMLLKVHNVSYLSGLTINLQSNCLGIEGAVALAGLVKRVNVISLNLSDQPPLLFGTRGCVALLDAITQDQGENEEKGSSMKGQERGPASQFPPETGQEETDETLAKRLTGIVALGHHSSVELYGTRDRSRTLINGTKSTVDISTDVPPILLEMLDLSGNSLNDSISSHLAEFLNRAPVLQHLSLARNKLGVRTCKVITDALHRSNRFADDPLTSLSLSWNLLGGRSGQVLVDALSDRLCLVQLDVSFCGLHDDFAQGLGRVLGESSSPTLRHLNLTRNRIGPSGAHAIAQGLCMNDHLEVLLVGFNPISYSGCKSLIESLKYNTTLISLGIENSWHIIANPNSGLESPDISPAMSYSSSKAGFGALGKTFAHRTSIGSLSSIGKAHSHVVTGTHGSSGRENMATGPGKECHGGRDLLRTLRAQFADVLSARVYQSNAWVNIAWEYPPSDLDKEFGKIVAMDSPRENPTEFKFEKDFRRITKSYSVKQPLPGNQSVFAPRIQESDSNSLYDTMSVVRLGFDADWLLLSTKLRCSLRGRQISELELSNLLYRLKYLLRKYFYRLSNIAMSYAIRNTDHSELVSLNDFVQFVNECNLCDATRGGTLMAMDTQVAFYSANSSLVAALEKLGSDEFRPKDETSAAETVVDTKFTSDSNIERNDSKTSIGEIETNDKEDSLNEGTTETAKEEEEECESQEQIRVAQEAIKLRQVAKQIAAMKDNPSNRMVRFEFLHSLVELAKYKYCRPKSLVKYPLCELDHALKVMLEEHVIPCASFHSSNQWRRDNLYWKDVDHVFRTHLALLRDIWNGITVKRGHKLLSYVTWQEVMQQCGLFSTNFTHKESAECFFYSNMLVTKEVGRENVDRARDLRGKLTWCEFIEALARVSAVVEPYEIGTNPGELLSVNLYHVLKQLFLGLRRQSTKVRWVQYFQQGGWSRANKNTPRDATRNLQHGQQKNDEVHFESEAEYFAFLETIYEPLEILENNGKFAF